jgi:hypothetical protein
LFSCRSSLLPVPRWLRDAADARAVFGGAFRAAVSFTAFRVALRAGAGFLCGGSPACPRNCAPLMPGNLPDPMLTVAVTSPDHPRLHAAEPKWDGFRALVSVDARVVLRSRWLSTSPTAAQQPPAAVGEPLEPTDGLLGSVFKDRWMVDHR